MIKQISIPLLPSARRKRGALQGLRATERTTKLGNARPAYALDAVPPGAEILEKHEHGNVSYMTPDGSKLSYPVKVRRLKEPVPGLWGFIADSFLQALPALKSYDRKSAPLHEVAGEGAEPSTYNLGLHETPLADGRKLRTTKNMASDLGQSLNSEKGAMGMLSAMIDESFMRMDPAEAKRHFALVALLKTLARVAESYGPRCALAVNVNLNAATFAHMDFKNLLNSICHLFVVYGSEGEVELGDLVILEGERKLVIRMAPGTHVSGPFHLFWHCNPPLLLRRGGARLAFIFYLMDGMIELSLLAFALSEHFARLNDESVKLLKHFGAGKHWFDSEGRIELGVINPKWRSFAPKRIRPALPATVEGDEPRETVAEREDRLRRATLAAREVEEQAARERGADEEEEDRFLDPNAEEAEDDRVYEWELPHPDPSDGAHSASKAAAEAS
ncbi:hypothetical protein DFJ74DRAFT_502581 [Hyaloraphidium curvatum]|nr:hypothetical protein DFJ74DRAFT_502581 [Hyaloraphidium curvatum]